MEENFGTKTPNYCCPEAQETLVLYYFLPLLKTIWKEKHFFTLSCRCGLCKVNPHHSKIQKDGRAKYIPNDKNTLGKKNGNGLCTTFFYHVSTI